MAVDVEGGFGFSPLLRLLKRRLLFAGERIESRTAACGADLLRRQQEAVREALPDGGLLLLALGGEREADAEARREDFKRVGLAQRGELSRRRARGMTIPGPVL